MPTRHPDSGEPKQTPTVLPWRGSDERLLELVRGGAPGAGHLLYDRFERVVHRLVWRVLGPDAEQEDVVQQVFEQIFLHIHSVRDASRLPGWVARVTVNVSRTEIRRRGRRRESAMTNAPAHTDDHVGQDLVRRTFAVLDQMSASLRVIFVLRFVEGYSAAETAEICGCSVATAHRRITRARARFEVLARKDEELQARLQGGEP